MNSFQSTPIQCLSVGPGPRTQLVIVPQQGQFVAGALTRHVEEWCHVTDDYVSLQAIVGVKIPLTGKPPVRHGTRREEDTDPVIDKVVKVVSTQAVVVSLFKSLQRSRRCNRRTRSSLAESSLCPEPRGERSMADILS